MNRARQLTAFVISLALVAMLVVLEPRPAAVSGQSSDVLSGPGDAQLSAALPVVKPGAGDVTEGNSGSQVLTVPVTLSNPSAETVTIDYATLDTGAAGIATAGSDYDATSGVVTFEPGQTTASVAITVHGDTVHEPPLLWGEWLLLAFTNPSGATLDTSFYGLGIGIILDDDPFEPPPAEPTRVMPLGDSITQGASSVSSYRYWLYKTLEGAGHEVDFVGSEDGPASGRNLYTDFDPDHEGHYGWRADSLAWGLLTWAPAYEPEAVLVHVGTNDLLEGQGVQDVLTDVGQIIATLRAAVPDVKILLAQIIGSTRTEIVGLIPELNAAIPALAQDLTTGMSPVYVVDQYSGFDPSTDTKDGLHPNESGEKKMAARWAEVLDEIL